jgi:hypothetical protein
MTLYNDLMILSRYTTSLINFFNVKKYLVVANVFHSKKKKKHLTM